MQFFYYFGIVMAFVVALFVIIWIVLTGDSICNYVKRFILDMIKVFIPLSVVLSLSYLIIDYFDDGAKVLYELVGIFITVVFIDFFHAERNRKEEEPLRELAIDEMSIMLKKLIYILENSLQVSLAENYSDRINEELRKKSWLNNKITLDRLDINGKFEKVDVYSINILYEKGPELRSIIDRVLKVYGSVLKPNELNFIAKLNLELIRPVSKQELYTLLNGEDIVNDLEIKYSGIEVVFNNLYSLYEERKGAKDDKRFLQRLHFVEKLQNFFKRKRT